MSTEVASRRPTSIGRGFARLPRGVSCGRILFCAVLLLAPATGSSVITKVQDLGTKSEFLLGSTSIFITLLAPGVTAGNSVVISFVMDVGTGTVGASDSAGNVYLKDADAAVVTGVVRRTIIFSSHGVLPIAAGGTITVTFPATGSRKAIVP